MGLVAVIGLACMARAMLGPVEANAVVANPQPAAQASPPEPTETRDVRFQTFVHNFRQTALASGIRADVYDRSMAGIARNPRVEELNLEQPEFAKPVWDYLDSVVTSERIANGEAALAMFAPTLANIEQRFGVSPDILVSIWGIETDYGQAMGGFNMFEALATLGYDGPRAEFGRRELLDALKMEQQENLDPKTMTSSWAGAFGQTQFLPSTFLTHAVDGDGDGRRDLWHSPADALASSASLLAGAGWEIGAPWGYEVALPGGFDYELADLDSAKSLSDWRELGVKLANGGELPLSAARSAMYLPAGARGPAFIVFDNFHVVLKYNNAASYALAVCVLADRLQGYPPVVSGWPRDELPLSREERLALQTDLKKLGFVPGILDGVLGRQARAALRAYQKSRGLVPDAFATEALLERMERELAAKGG